MGMGFDLLLSIYGFHGISDGIYEDFMRFYGIA
jgi:hypothetical protein